MVARAGKANRLRILGPQPHDAAFDWLQVANDGHDTYGARVYLELGPLGHAHAARQGGPDTLSHFEFV